MCYSVKSSLGAWLITFIICGLILSKPDKYNSWLPLFILTFTQIQIMESLLWTSIKNNDKDTNEKVTKLLPLILWLQPLANTYLGYVNSGNNVLFYGIFVYIFIIVYCYFIDQDKNFDTTVGPNGHLEWAQYNKEGKKEFSVLGNKVLCLIYLVGLIGPFFYMDSELKYAAIAFLCITFVINALKYTNEFGSMWCYTSTTLSLVTLLSTHLGIE